MDNSQVKTDDFFSLLEDEHDVDDPFVNDEIPFRDQNGNLSILKAGKILDFKKPEDNSKPQEPKKEEKKSAIDFNAEVENIIKKLGIHFSEKETEKRFRQAVLLRLKGVRNQVQTREILLSPISLGGLGFRIKEAEKILSVILNESQNFHDRLREGLSTEPFSDLQTEVDTILTKVDADTDKPEIIFSSTNDSKSQKVESDLMTVPEKKNKPVLPSSSNSDINNLQSQKDDHNLIDDLKKKEKLFQQPSAAAVEKIPAKPAKEKQDKEAELGFVSFSSVSRPKPPESFKPKIEDVRFRPKLTGPIEEIRSMTLVDFRRLSQNPQEAILKIIEKIENLEEESFSKKIQAIKAWKESMINQLYLEIGEESMEEKKSISEVIEQRRTKGLEILTEQEIEAIMEFNQKLRY